MQGTPPGLCGPHRSRGAGGEASGGGIEAPGGAAVNSTLAGNMAVGGLGSPTGSATGGGIVFAGAGTWTNSILADNSATVGPDCSGAVNSDGYNLLGDISGCSGFTGPGDLVNVDPILGPLQSNGGPTKTMALMAGSPAIDAIPPGVNGCGTTITRDQRGVARPQGPGCDIGAYEVKL